MKNSFLIPNFALATAIFYLLAGTASAQTIVSYKSPIADYQPFVEEKITSWKAANDKVGQIGGWRAYAKEAQQPDNTPNLPASVSPNLSPNAQPNPAPLQKPAGSSGDVMKTDPHAGHKK